MFVFLAENLTIVGPYTQHSFSAAEEQIRLVAGIYLYAVPNLVRSHALVLADNFNPAFTLLKKSVVCRYPEIPGSVEMQMSHPFEEVRFVFPCNSGVHIVPIQTILSAYPDQIFAERCGIYSKVILREGNPAHLIVRRLYDKNTF